MRPHGPPCRRALQITQPDTQFFLSTQESHHPPRALNFARFCYTSSLAGTDPVKIPASRRFTSGEILISNHGGSNVQLLDPTTGIVSSLVNCVADS